MSDDLPKLPLPPVDTPFNAGAADVTTAIYAVLSGLVLIYGLRYWIRTKNPIIILLLVGGFTTSLLEPYFDILGACWYHLDAKAAAFENMGRRIPWFCVFGYVFFFGAIGPLNYLAFRKGATTRQVWLWFGVLILADVVMEELMLSFGTYTYYGQQPLVLISKFPLWFAPSNSMGEFLGITLLVLMGPSLRGWRMLMIPLLMPVMDAVGYAAVAVPSIVAVNTPNIPMVLTQIAGLATFALAAVVVHCVALLIATDSPLRSRASQGSPLDLLMRSASAT